eukprot:m.252901 g.252901  ORF g.252901 m.252901 type:complete len:108 (-) comp10992_c0_seq1:1-324(-)
MHICSMGNQHFGVLVCMYAFSSIVKRSSSTLILDVDVCPMGDKQLDIAARTRKSGPVKRRLSVLTFAVDVGPMGDQYLESGRIPTRSGVERSFSRKVLAVNVGPVGK